MASNLLSQIASRTANFVHRAGISQGQLCRHLGCSDSSLSQFLHGTKSLDPSVIIKLCQCLSLSQEEVAEKFTEPVRSARIMSLQRSVEDRAAEMHLDENEGW